MLCTSEDLHRDQRLVQVQKCHVKSLTRHLQAYGVQYDVRPTLQLDEWFVRGKNEMVRVFSEVVLPLGTTTHGNMTFVFFSGHQAWRRRRQWMAAACPCFASTR